MKNGASLEGGAVFSFIIMLTLCADFSWTEQDREKEEHVQTLKGPHSGRGLIKFYHSVVLSETVHLILAVCLTRRSYAISSNYACIFYACFMQYLFFTMDFIAER